MSARCFQIGAVVSGKISTRRKSEDHGAARRFFMALRANYSFSVVLRGSPFLRAESFAMPAADDGSGVLS